MQLLVNKNLLQIIINLKMIEKVLDFKKTEKNISLLCLLIMNILPNFI